MDRYYVAVKRTYRLRGRCDSVSPSEVVFVVVVFFVVVVHVDVGRLSVLVSVLLSVLVLVGVLFVGFARRGWCYWRFILEKI